MTRKYPTGGTSYRNWTQGDGPLAPERDPHTVERLRYFASVLVDVDWPNMRDRLRDLADYLELSDITSVSGNAVELIRSCIKTLPDKSDFE